MTGKRMAAAAALTLGLSAVASEAPASEVFRDDEAGFEITVPDGWAVRIRGTKNVRAVLGSVDEDGASCVIEASMDQPAGLNASQAELDRLMTEAWAEEQASMASTSMPPGTTVSQVRISLIELHGRKAAAIDAVATLRVEIDGAVDTFDVPVRMLATLTPKRGYGLVCGGGAFGGDWPDAGAQALERSFRVLE